MHNSLLTRCMVLFLITTCFTLALQKSTDYRNNDLSQQQKPSENSAIRRDPRAIQKKPGFFRTLFSVIFEQFSDTKNTFSKVNTLLNDNFLPEDAPPITTSTGSPDTNVSTTTPVYKIKRSEFNKLLQRNLKGLVRLFNLELKDALSQSTKTNADFNRNKSIEVSKFL